LIPFDTTQITSAANRSNPKNGDPCHPLTAAGDPPSIAFHPLQDPISNINLCHAIGAQTSCSAAVAQPMAYGIDGDQNGSEELIGTLRSHHYEAARVAQPVAFGFDGAQSDNPKATHQFSAEMSPPLIKSRAMSVGGRDMAVRRLTPVECERLQGFPDNYTNIPWRKKPEAPDGPRYKALGNSMAVPVMRWIGQRIKENE
jgi:DNA (cytosine-5)-methyltransferase 1